MTDAPAVPQPIARIRVVVNGVPHEFTPDSFTTPNHVHCFILKAKRPAGADIRLEIETGDRSGWAGDR